MLRNDKILSRQRKYVAITIEEDLRMAKEIVSQHIILCRDNQLSKQQEPVKKNLSRPKNFLSRQKIAKDLKKSCHDRGNSVATKLPG